MIKPIGIWGLHSLSDSGAGGGGVCYFSPMRGIYQPLIYLLALMGMR